MGEVYRATDTRLDREVAIKILNRDVAGDPALRERFEREARVISKLNHPNICSLYDLGRENGVDYLVMEYLHGETLAARIARGPLQTDEVLRIGAQIATALDRAHRQGIVHRDLKPGNVMLTKSGVKLLDFGLAKLTTSVASPPLTSATPLRPVEEPLTQEGAILGTFQYMAPEQVSGKPADARSDIFAAGTILYEMATGRRAFEAGSTAGIMAAVLERDPPSMAALRPETPAALERVVRACLAKDPDERIQTAHDLALDLKWIGESSVHAEPRRAGRSRFAPWLVAALAAGIASAALYVSKSGKPARPFSLSIVSPPGHTFLGPDAVSHDGTKVALLAMSKSGELGIWLRRLDDPNAKLLAKKSPLISSTIFWSPDDRWVAWGDIVGAMMRVAVDGGEPERIASTGVAGGGAWNTDGTVLFSPRFGLGLYRVPASGGVATPLSRLDPKLRESIHCRPLFLPGGRRFLYLVHTVAEQRNRIYGSSLDDGKAQFIMEADALVGYAKPYLLFVRDAGIYAQKFDADRMSLQGQAARVIDDVTFREPDAMAWASASDDGVIAYMPYQHSSVLFNVYDRSGSRLRTSWTDDDLWMDSEYADLRLSSSGRSLLVSDNDHVKGAPDVTVIDLARGISSRVTAGLSANRNAAWSRDEQTIAFSSDRDGFYDVYITSRDPAAPERLLWKSDFDKHVADWSPDGKNLLVSVDGATTRRDIWVVPLDGAGKRWPLVQTTGVDTQPQFSPDGRWVAYMSDQSGTSEVYVCAFPSGATTRISVSGGRVPTWSPDGRELLFSTGSGDVMLASVRPNGTRMEAGTPMKLFSRPELAQAPRFMPDGHILIGEPAARTTSLMNVTTAWRSRAP